MDGPLILLPTKLVDLMPLHVACVYRLTCWVEYHRHLEQEHVVGGHWCAAQIITHAVKVVAVAEELTTEATEDQDVLAVELDCAASLSLWEHFVIHFNLLPLALVRLVISLDRVDVLASGVSNTTEYVNGSVAESAGTVVVTAYI